ncbi:hypothetical protein Syun_023180 [Stephania yunnanensis]|uniref:Uncharacterized protein n=1 Tax=Stephania yunnanensis TaxID=152371 RepID=A0AAP0FN35_9MAGN
MGIPKRMEVLDMWRDVVGQAATLDVENLCVPVARGRRHPTYLCRGHGCVVEGVGRVFKEGRGRGRLKEQLCWCWREGGGDGAGFGQRDRPAVETEERQLRSGRGAEQGAEAGVSTSSGSREIHHCHRRLRQGCADRPAGVRGAAAPGHKTCQRWRRRRRLVKFC